MQNIISRGKAIILSSAAAICPLIALAFVPAVNAGIPVAATYNFGAAAFVENADGTTIYAAENSLNAVAVINAATLTVTNTISIGSNPTALTLSPDGTRLYVADSGSDFIGVLDTQTLTTLPSIAVTAGSPHDLQEGSDGRLWVSTASGIGVVNPSTGAYTAAISSPFGSADIRVSPDGKYLYAITSASSPATLYKYDVSGSAATQVWAVSGGTTINGMALSRDGSLVAVAGGGNYEIQPLRTSDGLALGTFNTGPYPQAIAFAPNNAVAYTGLWNPYGASIGVYSLSTYLPVSTADAAGGDVVNLFVDNSGHYLFADLGGSTTQVFDVSAFAPEPATLAIFALGLAGLALKRRRPRQTAC